MKLVNIECVCMCMHVSKMKCERSKKANFLMKFMTDSGENPKEILQIYHEKEHSFWNN